MRIGNKAVGGFWPKIQKFEGKDRDSPSYFTFIFLQKVRYLSALCPAITCLTQRIYQRMQRLSDFIQEQQASSQISQAALLRFVEGLGQLANSLSKSISKAGLLDILGSEDSSNVSGDQQQKLDLLADRLLLDIFGGSGLICGIASEENSPR